MTSSRIGRTCAYLIPAPQPRATIRRWDREAIALYGIPEIILMENAGDACARHIAARIDGGAFPAPVHVVCGGGNNGGDGYVIARHLHNRGVAVRVYPAETTAAADPTSAVAVNREIIRRMGLAIEPAAATAGELDAAIGRACSGGVIVDALFGTGLSRPVDSPHREWIDAINASGRLVVSIDIPSGLDADTGRVLGAAVRATETLTLVAPKLGFTLADGPRFVGRVETLGISIPRDLLARER